MSTTPAPCTLGLSSEQLSAWRDRALPAIEMQRIAQHLPNCAACQRRLAHFDRIAAAVQAPPPRDLRPLVWGGVQARLTSREQRIMRFPRAAALSSISAAALLLIIAALFLIVLQQHKSSTAVGNGGTATATTGAPTVNPTSTSLPVTTTAPPTTVPGCNTLLPAAGPAAAGPSFPDLAFPPNSLGNNLARIGGGGDGQFTIYQLELCTANASPSAINSFFANLATTGWLHSNTFPLDGAYQSACSVASCWAKDIRYYGLSTVSDQGNGVVRYHLILATAPPVPDCSGAGNTFSTGYYYLIPNPNYTTTQVFATIPLPPLTRIVPNDASGGVRGYDFCSAGTVAAISAFMTAHLTSLGWVAGPNNTWTKSGYMLNVLVTSPTEWNIHWRDPDMP